MRTVKQKVIQRIEERSDGVFNRPVRRKIRYDSKFVIFEVVKD